MSRIGENHVQLKTGVPTDVTVPVAEGLAVQAVASGSGNKYNVASAADVPIAGVAIEACAVVGQAFTFCAEGTVKALAADAENFAVGAEISCEADGTFKEAGVDEFVVGRAVTPTGGGDGEYFYLELYNQGYYAPSA